MIKETTFWVFDNKNTFSVVQSRVSENAIVKTFRNIAEFEEFKKEENKIYKKLTCEEIENVGEILRKEREGMASFGAWRK